jgi:hypothetical protein
MSQRKPKNWYQRHPNKTYTIAIILTIILVWALYFVLLMTNMQFSNLRLVFQVITYIFLAIFGIWTLSQKNRSMWYILWIFIFPWALLLLEDKSIEEEPEKSDREWFEQQFGKYERRNDNN